MNRLMTDLAIDRKNNPDAALQDQWDEEEEDDDDDEGGIIDRSTWNQANRSS